MTTIETVKDYIEWLSSRFDLDGFHTMLLERGQEFTPAPLPKGIRQGTMKLCFHNSEMVAKRKGLAYCEGLAISSKVLGLPIHHAWNVTEDGTVVDTTWVPEGVSYFGIVVPQDEWIDENWRTALGVFA